MARLKKCKGNLDKIQKNSNFFFVKPSLRLNIIINRFETSSLKVTLTSRTKVEKKMLSSEAELEAIIREQIEKALAAQLTELMTRKREKAVLLKEEKIKSKRPLRLRRPWKECGVRKLWKKEKADES